MYQQIKQKNIVSENVEEKSVTQPLTPCNMTWDVNHPVLSETHKECIRDQRVLDWYDITIDYKIHTIRIIMIYKMVMHHFSVYIKHE